MTTINISMDESARLHIRPMPVYEAGVTLVTMLGRSEALRSEIPVGFKGIYDAQIAQAKTLQETLQALLVPTTQKEADNTPLPVPEELLVIASADSLRTPRKVNNLLDGLVRNIDQITEGLANNPMQDPETAPAQLLRARWFADGRVYLQFENPLQWYAIHTLFSNLSPQEQEAVETLRLSRLIARIVALNEHFGRLLSVTEDDLSNPPSSQEQHETEVATTMGHFMELMRAMIGLANAMAPTEDQDAYTLRRKLIAPYTDPITAAIEERRARAVAAQAERDSEANPNSDDEGA